METMPNLSGITGASSEDSYSIRNNYRFDALLRAIDFFSQKFNLETLIDFSGDFINEILTLGQSAVFIYSKEDDCFDATKIRLYKTELKKVPNSTRLQNIAKLYGSTITKNFSNFFSDEFNDAYKPSLLIPLIHANTLLGFIVTSGKAVGELTDDDFRMADAIMHLFNNAFERHYYMEVLDNRDERLNHRVFETINKASKVLFSEINLDNLITDGIEIFSELSGSMNTAFGILDADKNAIRAKAYSDVTKNTPGLDNFLIDFVDNPEFEKDKHVYLLDEEFDLLRKIFANPEKFREFNTKYVVLIVTEKILGFVTLGKNIKYGGGYSKETLELINSLAISCFTALQNAMMFEELSNQKKEAEIRYNELLKLER